MTTGAQTQAPSHGLCYPESTSGRNGTAHWHHSESDSESAGTVTPGGLSGPLRHGQTRSVKARAR